MSKEYNVNESFEVINVINDEQLLNFALSYLAERNDEDEVHPLANDIVIYYIVKQFQKDGKHNFTSDDVHEQFQILLADHIINNLVSKNYLNVSIDENGKEYFSLTDKLSEHVKENLDD